MKTRPEQVLDILLQHPYYQTNQAPVPGYIVALKKKYKTSLTEIEKAFTTFVERNQVNEEDCYNPELIFSGKIATFQPFENGKCAILKPKQSKKKEWGETSHKALYKDQCPMGYVHKTEEYYAFKVWYYQTYPDTEAVCQHSDGTFSPHFRPGRGERP